MSQRAAFVVRDYPSFRPARLFRVILSPEAIYFVRMRGLVGQADAATDFVATRQQKAIAGLIRLWAGRSIADGIEQVDRADPEELVRSNTKNFRVAPGDFRSSRLEPPAVLGGHGAHYARWKFALNDGRKMTLQLEDPEDLETAITHLPKFLGSVHENKVALYR